MKEKKRRFHIMQVWRTYFPHPVYWQLLERACAPPKRGCKPRRRGGTQESPGSPPSMEKASADGEQRRAPVGESSRSRGQKVHRPWERGIVQIPSLEKLTHGILLREDSTTRGRIWGWIRKRRPLRKGKNKITIPVKTESTEGVITA